jgi:hypothetical protein
MDYTRLLLAALGGFVAYFVFGGLSFVLIPSMKTEFLKYPAIYRPQEGQMRMFPVGMAAIFVAILVVAALFAMIYPGGAPVTDGVRFGALIGVFVVGGFVVHNYVNLNIGIKVTVMQAVAYFSEWLIVGIVISLIYRGAGH